MEPDLLIRCADLIYQEAAYLDERRWVARLHDKEDGHA